MAVTPPTRPELIDQLKDAVDYLEEAQKFGHLNTKNLLELEEKIQNANKGRGASLRLEGTDAARAAFNDLVANPRAILDPVILRFGDFFKVPERDPEAIIRPHLFEDFLAAGDTILSRGITFDLTPTSAGVGDGELLRLVEDQDAVDIESIFVEKKKLECTDDANSGAPRNREIFSFKGETLEDDEIKRVGSGEDTSLTSVDPTLSLFANSGFDIAEGPITAPTGIPSWDTGVVPVNGTNFEFDESDAGIYLPRQSAKQTRRSLVIKVAAVTLKQRLDLRRRSIVADVPIVLQLAFNREIGAAAGTLKITLGTATVTVILVGQLGWNRLRIPLGALTSWLEGFNVDTLTMEIDWSGGSGELRIDDLIIAPMTKIDANWWLLMPGRTPWLRKDTFETTDVFAGIDSKIQQWIWRAYPGLYLPHASVPSIADPV